MQFGGMVPPAAAPPWSCRCPAVPRRSANPASAFPACASARRRVPDRSWRRGCAGAGGRKRMRRIPRQAEAWQLRVVVSDSSASVTSHRWPPRTSVMRQTRACSCVAFSKIAGSGDFLVVDVDDDRPSGSRHRRWCRRRPDRSPRRLRYRNRDAARQPLRAECSRPLRPVTASVRSIRFRRGRYRARFAAAPSVSLSCPRATHVDLRRAAERSGLKP